MARKPFDFHLVSVDTSVFIMWFHHWSRVFKDAGKSGNRFGDKLLETLICKRAIPNAKRDFVQLIFFFFQISEPLPVERKTQNCEQSRSALPRMLISGDGWPWNIATTRGERKKKGKGKRMLTPAAKCCRGMQTFLLSLVCMCACVWSGGLRMLMWADPEGLQVVMMCQNDSVHSARLWRPTVRAHVRAHPFFEKKKNKKLRASSAWGKNEVQDSRKGLLTCVFFHLGRNSANTQEHLEKKSPLPLLSGATVFFFFF